MVRHIVFWKLREDYAAQEQADYALQVLTAST